MQYHRCSTVGVINLLVHYKNHFFTFLEQLLTMEIFFSNIACSNKRFVSVIFDHVSHLAKGDSERQHRKRKGCKNGNRSQRC